jgi:hypothetical protein
LTYQIAARYAGYMRIIDRDPLVGIVALLSRSVEVPDTEQVQKLKEQLAAHHEADARPYSTASICAALDLRPPTIRRIRPLRPAHRITEAAELDVPQVLALLRQTNLHL